MTTEEQVHRYISDLYPLPTEQSTILQIYSVAITQHKDNIAAITWFKQKYVMCSQNMNPLIL
jgi:hypothetical protein